MIRARIVIWTVTGVLLFLVFGLLNLEVIHGKVYQDLGNKNCIRLVSQNGSRGSILDREGRVIADNKLSYDLMILPQDAPQQEKIILNASRILGKSVKDLKSAFKSGYVSSSVPVTLARNISVKDAIALAELKVDLPAIIVQPNPLRHYPNGKLAGWFKHHRLKDHATKASLSFVPKPGLLETLSEFILSGKYPIGTDPQSGLRTNRFEYPYYTDTIFELLEKLEDDLRTVLPNKSFPKTGLRNMCRANSRSSKKTDEEPV